MGESGSAILSALYQRRHDEARRLAAASPRLTVCEAAALGDDDALADLLRDDPAAVNAHGSDGFHPVALAAYFAPASTVRLLLDAGADVSVASANQMRVQALHAAVASRNLEAVQVLLDHGADANARQQVGYTPLMGAAGSGRDDIVDLLLDRGADPTVVAEDGKTAASVARDHGHSAMAARLEAPASPRA